MEQENKEQMQKTFNKVAAHLLTQGRKSVKEDGRCKYRTEDGLKCAVGCLIPDEMYSPNMEDKSIGYLLEQYPGLRTIPEINGFDLFLSKLQKTHDNYRVVNWVSGLKEAAKEFNLNSDVVDEYVKQN